jgi:hypothetical protein
MGNCCLSTGKYQFSDREMALIVKVQSRVRVWLAKRLLKRVRHFKITQLFGKLFGFKTVQELNSPWYQILLSTCRVVAGLSRVQICKEQLAEPLRRTLGSQNPSQ